MNGWVSGGSGGRENCAEGKVGNIMNNVQRTVKAIQQILLIFEPIKIERIS